MSPTNIDRSLNPITAESDWHLISPNNITPKFKPEGHETKGTDHQLKKLLIVRQILLVRSLEMFREQYAEYAYWC